jgi:hypothetical protein
MIKLTTNAFIPILTSCMLFMTVACKNDEKELPYKG